MVGENPPPNNSIIPLKGNYLHELTKKSFLPTDLIKPMFLRKTCRIKRATMQKILSNHV